MTYKILRLTKLKYSYIFLSKKKKYSYILTWIQYQNMNWTTYNNFLREKKKKINLLDRW